MSPADTNRPHEIAISATTRPLLTRPSRRPEDPRASSLRISATSVREARKAGIVPARMVERNVRPITNAITPGSRLATSQSGNSWLARAALKKSIPILATTRPAAAPTTESTRASASSCDTVRHRLAPSAVRIATSFDRMRVRASSRLATFAQAMSSTPNTALFRSERPSENGLHPEQIEHVGAAVRAKIANGLPFGSTHVHGLSKVRRDALEALLLISPVLEVVDADRHEPAVLRRPSPEHGHELIGVLKRQPLQNRDVHDAEHRRRQTDPQRQGNDGTDTETRTLDEHPDAKRMWLKNENMGRFLLEASVRLPRDRACVPELWLLTITKEGPEEFRAAAEGSRGCPAASDRRLGC